MIRRWKIGIVLCLVLVGTVLAACSTAAPAPAQDGDDRSLLVGIWISSGESVYGPYSSETILQRDGRFSQTVRAGELMTYDTGTYTVLPEGKAIHFTVLDHEPKTYKGRPMDWVNSFTTFYQTIDADTMIWEDHIAGSRWQVTRR
ncbi:MAG: hypothetical protein NTV33_05295 [Coprothermobacterota bacterium]|nr:hypothetical protein [Coprothermobacterota bacterium]